MKRESTIGRDVAGVAIGVVLSVLLYNAVGAAILPDIYLNDVVRTHTEKIIWSFLSIAALLGMTLPAHGIRLHPLMGGAILVGIWFVVHYLRTYGPQMGTTSSSWEHVVEYSVLASVLAVGPAAALAASFLFGIVTAWGGCGLLSLVKRQSHIGQQAASAWGTAKEGVRPAAEEVAITRH